MNDYLVTVCAEIIKSINKDSVAGLSGPGLGIRALSLSEQTAANVPMHIEEYSQEYPQPFSPEKKIKLGKKKKNRKLKIEEGATEVLSLGSK